MITVPSEILVDVHGTRKIIKRDDLYAVLLRIEVKRRSTLRKPYNREITWIINNLNDAEILQVYQDGCIRLQYRNDCDEPRKAIYTLAKDDFLSSILLILIKEGKECILKKN